MAEFKVIMISKKDLKEKYFYKEDLIKLCKKYGISSRGTKADIFSRLLKYISVGKIKRINFKRRSKFRSGKITLNSFFFKDGLRFNDELRNFFSDILGKDKISFNKYMATAVRNAEKSGKDITTKKLLDILKNPKKYHRNTAEEKTYQWNNFVKDFHKSKFSRNYKNKLKVSAILWKKVKLSRNPKIYKNSLLKKYRKEVKNYLIIRGKKL